MTRVAGLLRSLDGRAWVDEDGEAERLELPPPLTDAQIDALAAVRGVPVPAIHARCCAWHEGWRVEQAARRNLLRIPLFIVHPIPDYGKDSSHTGSTALIVTVDSVDPV
ncbi:hypothetical protein [Longimicrobium sp.]|uniref:hypothetical protein n=1 Tax=Longimicrobium sp. TaxID=2029185 RepID=UPI003B3AA75A